MTDEFTDDHWELVQEVETIVETWRVRMPWVQGWIITVEPAHPEPEDAFDPSPARIESSLYTRMAKLYIKEIVRTCDIAEFLPPGEYSLDLIVVHELCHLLFEHWRAHIPTSCDLLPVMVTEEEKVIWDLSRTLIALAKGPSHETDPVL